MSEDKCRNWSSSDGDHSVTDSRVLGKTFGKRHTNVLRAYDSPACSADFSRLNFEPRDYVDESGKVHRSIMMTKDGWWVVID